MANLGGEVATRAARELRDEHSVLFLRKDDRLSLRDVSGHLLRRLVQARFSVRGTVRARDKKSLLHRLYLSHLALLAVVTFVVGLATLILANVPDSPLSRGWIRVLPAKDIGSAFLSTAIIIVAFEYFYREEAELRAEERSKKLFPAQAAAVMSDLYQRIGSDDGLVFSMLSTETIDKIITNSLARRLGEADLAREVYTDLRNQVIASAERWRDSRSPSVFRGMTNPRGAAQARC
jgi:ABC-type multidrug transport system fused ATPase/permease subunit